MQPLAPGVRRTAVADAECEAESGHGLDGLDRVASNGPGVEISMPHIYACDDTIANRQLSVLNDSPFDAVEPVGFDPYNTGRIDTSKAWNSRSNR